MNKSKLIDLETKHGEVCGYKKMGIKKAPAFAFSKIGSLCHRTIGASLHYPPDNKKPHLSISFLCGNGVVGKNAMFSDDPEDRLVCIGCEKKAKELELPTASQLAGRHVCTGKLKPIVDCKCSNKSHIKSCKSYSNSSYDL